MGWELFCQCSGICVSEQESTVVKSPFQLAVEIESIG
jgi:hypothetical protein